MTFEPVSERRKFDVHAHVLPTNVPDFEKKFGYPGFISLRRNGDDGSTDMMKGGSFFRRVEANCFDYDVRMKEMDHIKVDVQAVSTVPVMFNYWAKAEDNERVARFLNDDIVGECTRSESRTKRFFPMGTLPMQSAELAIKELRRCVTELGLTAFEIGSNINGMDLDHRDLFPFYKAAEELNVCLFVHPWDMDNWGGRLNKYWLPWLLAMPSETAQAICCILMGGVLESFPRLRFCFAHGGGSYPQIAGRVAHGFTVRPDLCATACTTSPQMYHGRFWCDSIVHEPNALRQLVELIGDDRVCFGTDYPFPLGELKVGQAVELCDALSDQQKDKVLWKNALDMFMLDENRFLL